MNRYASAVNNFLQKLGWPGTLGLGLLLFGIVLYQSAIVPARQQLEEVRAKAAGLSAPGRLAGRWAAGANRSPAQQLADLYAAFPPAVDIPNWLEKIYGLAAAERLTLAQGEYRLVGEPGAKFARYQISLPLKGNYVQIRKFTAAVLNELEVVSLDVLRFERPAGSDAMLDAEVRFTLFVKRGEGDRVETPAGVDRQPKEPPATDAAGRKKDE